LADGNAKFFKQLELVYNTVTNLEEEIGQMPNTKKEIKALVASLSNATEGLIKWDWVSGRVKVNSYTRGSQTDNATNDKKQVQVSSPDRPSSENLAAIKAVHELVITQGEATEKLAHQVESIKQQQYQQQGRREARDTGFAQIHSGNNEDVVPWTEIVRRRPPATKTRKIRGQPRLQQVRNPSVKTSIGGR